MASELKVTSVHNAAARGDLETLLELVKDRQALLAMTDAGWTLLHTAAQHDNDRVVTLFLGGDNPALELDVNAQANLGETALHVCSIFGSARVAALLLAHNADPRIADSEKWTPVHYAARFGHQPVLNPTPENPKH
ncbi:ankyrin repeat-containing domain protein [Baffinella frigidus]|nr:ankyrin repeat-containing domain protein [Cryptophyta sp. CCMP2293]